VTLSLAPGEKRSLRIVPIHESEKVQGAAAGNSFTNAFYRASWEPQKGLTELVDLASGKSIVDATARVGLGGPVYQVFPNGNRLEANVAKGPRVRPHDEISFGRCTAIRRVLPDLSTSDGSFAMRSQARATARYLLRSFTIYPRSN